MRLFWVVTIALSLVSSASADGSYQICANSFIEACKAQGKTEDERLGCLADNLTQCQDCALYEGGLKEPSLLPRTLGNENMCPSYLDGSRGKKWAANFKPATIPAGKEWTQTRRCFGTVDDHSYATPQHVYICVDTSKECQNALDHYYVFDKISFGCAAENRSCPSMEEMEAANPPDYCWPMEYLQTQNVERFLPGNRPAWDDLRHKVDKIK